MRKKAMMALMLTAVLVLAPVSGELSVTAKAAEDAAAGEITEASADASAAESVSDSDVSGNATGTTTETTQKKKLDVPTGLQWDKDGTMTWNEVADAHKHYELELYRDGEKIRTTNCGASLNAITYDLIDESGAYQFRVKSTALYDRDNYEDSEFSDLSPVYTYVKPDAVLGTPTCWWSETNPRTICWSAVEGADEYSVIFHDGPNSRTWQYVSSSRLSADVTSYIEKYVNDDEKIYWFTIRAISGDIEKVVSGVESEPLYYDTEAAAGTISGIISGAMENAEPAEALGTIKSSIDKTELRTAMQTDDAVLNQIKTLESSFATNQNITVKQPEVSEEAGRFVKAEDISVVGAGLNAASGQSVGLEVSVPEQKVPVNYAKSVQLDIRLTRGGESVHELDIPVTITLPIPSGLDAARLVILHYNEDGGCERVNFRLSGDGTVTFTVSSFSTFAFAQEQDGEEEGSTPSGSDSSDDNASSGNDDKAEDNSSADNNDAGGSSNGGNDDSSAGGSGAGGNDFAADVENQIKGAAKGATVKITGLNTLSNGMMKALLARKDVTLVMEYTYGGKNYTVVIPAGAAVDNDIPWYGPLYLAGYYGNGGSPAAGSVYSVQSGDTMSKIAKINRMTLAQLAAKNPQIRNINLIRVGQKINL
ncbi:MAG: LysM peptidoglycan-binding domain-containing protein [Bacteroidales bacterium]|nr:LysM peptidoglycan-binding domain-containing protein [Lachnoclostridium sp.]MCM1384374.1 LysM peptidoglycan-binding domain-containing protein [Lachnoclostridium sp.]MCM1466414.1 LysM peptidoglycan-binding domain-containing protein [Bacteroidales bacterium]